MTTIVLDNATSQVRGLSPENLGKLKRLIAYQAVPMPPRSVREAIRAYNEATVTTGAENLLRGMMATAYYRGVVAEAGWERRLSPRLVQAVLSKRTTWDGWSSLVSAGGHFGTGLVHHVVRAMTLRLGLPEPHIHDARTAPPLGSYAVGPDPDLYDFQEEALQAWINAGYRGVIALPPRSGKTRIMIAAVAHTKVPTLIVVPRVGLVQQTVNRFLECGFPAAHVIGVHGGKLTKRTERAMSRALVWVSTAGTAAGGQKGMGITGIGSRHALFIDEFHRSAAKTWQQISKAARSAYYRLGVTGTHYRADGKGLCMASVLAEAVYERSVAEMVAIGRLVPTRAAMIQLPRGYHIGAQGRELHSNGVARDRVRNGLLAQAARSLTDRGKRVLVLTREVEHSRVLSAMIPGSMQVDGSDNKQVRPALDALSSGATQCVVGTAVIGEGVDVPRADALVYAAAGKSRVKVVQDVFRVLTQSAGKTHGIVIDCADTHHPALTESAAHRLGLYRANGFETDVVDAADTDTWVAANC